MKTTNRIDVGARIGCIVILRDAGKSRYNTRLVLCRCDCGREFMVGRNDLRRRGRSATCHCVRWLPSRQSAEVRLWRSVKKTDSCWLWQGRKNKTGYGSLFCAGKIWRAHRLSWFLANGPIPAGMVVCHHCDNPACVRVDHLFLGTQVENIRDARDKHRLNYSGITVEVVLEIRKRFETGGISRRGLARVYGVHNSTICKIISRKTWPDVEWKAP